jgi:uncharacterized protein
VHVRPVAEGDRLDVLDALRGLSLLGILLANVMVFAGVLYLDHAARAAMPYPKLDAAVRWLQVIFIEGKFYGLFSLLFGIGAGLQLGVGSDHGRNRLFRRRMVVLAAIGFLHSMLWTGDILFFYAVLGLFLPSCARMESQRLLQLGFGLFAVAAGWQYFVFGGITLFGLPSGWPFALAWDYLEPHYAAMDAAQWRGDVVTMARYNLTAIWADRWSHLIASGRPFKVFGCFLIGMWAVRAGIPAALGAHWPLLKRVTRLALPIGLIGATALAIGRYQDPDGVFGTLMPITEAIGILGLTLGYAALFAMVWQQWRPALLQLFQPLGRMALTVYLMHTVIFLFGLSELGVGWFMRIGAAHATVLALPVILMQIVFAQWWLARFRFGPAEWLWRSLTYGTRQPMRRS